MRTVAFVILGGLVAVVSTARAETNFEEAGRHFTAAKKAFDEKHFKVAAGEFQQAYDAAKDPVLLYNVAESWEKAGDGKKAVAAYKAYLKAQPKAQDRADVQKRVKTITAQKFKLPNQSAPGDEPSTLAVVTPPTTAPPTTAPPTVAPTPTPSEPVAPPPAKKEAMMTPDFLKDTPPQAEAPPPATLMPPPNEPPPPSSAPPPGFLDERPPSKMRIAAWVGVALTVAVLTAGAIFGLAAQSRADEITRRETFIDASGQPKVFTADEQTTYKNLRDEGNLYNGLAIGFFAAAGATAVATTVLFVLDAKRKPKPHAMRIEPMIGPHGGALSLSWSF
jgi:hypothetical protein